MRTPFNAAAVQIKNGETKRVERGESWGTEGNAVVVTADADGFEVMSCDPAGK
jgi:hypothetical protein